VALVALQAMLAPHIQSGRLDLRLRTRAVAVETSGDVVSAVHLRDAEGVETEVAADYVLDATELGDLLPLAGVEYVTGAESQAEHGEPHAPAAADPLNMQAITWCFALDHVEGGDFTIDRPRDYDFWRAYRPSFWPNRLFDFTYPFPQDLRPLTTRIVPNPEGDPAGITAIPTDVTGTEDLWLYRRILARKNFVPGAFESDITLANWPQHDYWEGPIIEVSPEAVTRHLEGARQLSLSLLYWLQTEAPRQDGGIGYPGLRLRPDVMGTDDGLAKAPYIREARRIRAEQTITENDISAEVRGDRGVRSYPDSVGLGMYRIDLHPSTGGDGYIDLAAVPYELPLGALIPERVDNLLPACKNIGTTHLANACYRQHPTEWVIGEVAGIVAAECIDAGRRPREVRGDAARVERLQRRLADHGVDIRWPVIGAY
jgi:hypothetical protein